MVLTCVAISDISQTDSSSHILKLAVAVRRASKAIKRMIGDIELHDPTPEFLKSRSLSRNTHPIGDGSRA
jgi:phage shock protein A